MPFLLGAGKQSFQPKKIPTMHPIICPISRGISDAKDLFLSPDKHH
jgi:hypothetical protein